MARFYLAPGLSLFVALALPLTASAQTWGGSQPTPPAADPIAQPEPPPPQPVEPVAPVEASTDTTAPPPPAPAAEPVTDDTANRPVGMSLGIGAGYSFPTPGGGSLLAPNLASARFRFPTGLTFEPAVELSTSKQKTDFGPTEIENESNEIRVSTLARIPMAARGKVDLQLVGGAGLGVQKTNPEGDDNDTTTTTLFATWGLALEYWPKPRWGLSATALNPLLALSKTKQEMAGADQTTTSLSIGAIWDPSIFAMLHMYF
jgi:hypothetical protein